jgi:putative transposase
MRCLLTGYALYFNRRHDRRGHLFQDRYRSIVCEEEPYLLELVRYIHLNPLRGKVVGNLRELEKYPWSGHAILMGTERNNWQEKEYILRRFHRERAAAVRAYARFVAEGEDHGRRPEFTEDRKHGGWSRVLTLRKDGRRLEQGGRVLGNEDFLSKILREADNRLRRQLPAGKGHNVIHRVIREMCDDEGVNEQELRHGGQRKKVSRLRARIAWRLSRDLGISMAEIARQLGVSTSGIANAIRTIEGKAKSE